MTPSENTVEIIEPIEFESPNKPQNVDGKNSGVKQKLIPTSTADLNSQTSD